MLLCLVGRPHSETNSGHLASKLNAICRNGEIYLYYIYIRMPLNFISTHWNCKGALGGCRLEAPLGDMRALKLQVEFGQTKLN